MKSVFLIVLLLFVSGCGRETRFEDYGVKSEADLVLTPQNHPHGYGQNECFSCHVNENIHQVNKLNSPLFDYAKPLVDQSGLRSCSGCHGTNGITP